jgi:hypothetical protein
LLEQRSAGFVVVGQAAVGEPMTVAAIQEQLCLLDDGGELVGDLEIAASTKAGTSTQVGTTLLVAKLRTRALDRWRPRVAVNTRRVPS